MDISCLEEEVANALRERISNGETEREIAQKCELSQGHLNALKNGKRKISGLSLESFFKLFPQAIISLRGNCPYSEKDFEARLSRIKDKIMAADIPPEAKEKVYNIINSVQ